VSASDSPSNGKKDKVLKDSDANELTANSGFYGALDRFAQFFIHPLFLEDTLDREIQSVDSENKKNLQSDTWRLHQLQQSLSNPAHPFNHFSTGNWSTLHEIPLGRGQNLRNEFMKFYQDHYSANRMKLVVLGLESLDVLQQWTVNLFSPITNKDLPMLRWDNLPVYTEDQYAHQIFAKPVLDSRYLDLRFPFPNDENLFESQPASYISHLIGHEGPGSLLSYLKEKGWANELSAGNDEVCHGENVFDVQIRLTEAGLQKYQEVLEATFQYLSMLTENQPKEWIFDEQKVMSEVNFRFRQTAKASKTTSYISGIMQHAKYPRSRILSANSVLKKFDPQAILEAQACLTPEKCRFILVSQNYPGTWESKEQWYGTEYTYSAIPQDLRQRLSKAFKSSSSTRPPEFHLPHKNEFIPTRFEVEKKEVAELAKAPKLIRNDQFVRTWYLKDDRFWVPKASLNICLRTPLAYVTPRCAVMTQLYCSLVQDSLNEYSYDADLAGLSYALSSDSLGLSITVVGYNDKMALLLEKLLSHMKDFELKESRFDIYKERYARSYKNWGFKQPFNQVGHYKAWVHSDRFWTTDNYATELDSVHLQDLQTFVPQLLQQFHIEIFAYGNLYKEDALKLTDLCERTLKPYGLPTSQWPSRRSLIVPTGSNFIYARPLPDPANVNHCVEFVVWAGSNHDRSLRAKAMLVAQIADEPCYDQLRTKEQLGYVVFSGVTLNLHRVGFRVLVQSEKSPEYLEGRIESFLEQFERQIDEMDEAKFEKHKSSVISRLKETSKNMREEFDRVWSNISSEYFDFDSGK
jgi:insulysin